MKDQSAPLYNLDQAQQILTSLTPVVPGQPLTPILPEGGASFVRLSLSPLAVESRPKSIQELPTADADRKETIARPPYFETWEDCISWCMEVTRSEAAFVVDSQGFIIASYGRIPGKGFECTGAEMVCSVDLLERIDPDAGKLTWVDLDYDRRRIVGFIAPTDNSEFFIIGLVSPDSDYSRHKQVISRQIMESLPTID